MAPLKLAVIGTGHLGKFHTRILAGLPEVELVGVVDAAADVAVEVAREYGTSAYSSASELVGKIDAAVVAVPTRYHHEVAMPLLEQGIHLLIEKPLAPTAQQARELVEAAAKRNLVLGVGHVERFNPAWCEVAGTLGEPKYIEASRLGAYTFRSTDIGVVLDLMIHDLDLLLSLVGQPVREVEALGVSLFGHHEDIANARILFEGGCVANVTASRICYQHSRGMQVWTPQRFAGIDFAARKVTVVDPCEDVLNRRFDADQLAAEEKEYVKAHLFDEILEKREIVPEPQDQLTAELQDFVTAIRQGTRPRADGAAAAEAITLAEWILQKIEAHPWRAVASGPCGPRASFTPNVLSGPHWHLARHLAKYRREEAA